MTDFPEFSHVGEVLRKVQDRLTAIEAEVRYLRERSAEVEGKIGTIEGRLSAIDQRIDALDERIRAPGAAGEGKSQSRKNPKPATARKSPSEADLSAPMRP
jgi:phage shock protein A